MEMGRRDILLGGMAAAVLMLSACANFPALSLTEAIRRLLTRSSQNAFALLLEPGGFYDNQVSRIALPDQLGGNRTGSILSVILQSKSFREKLQRQLNRSAEKGAERAAPLVADAVRTVGIANAKAIIEGGPYAASTFLRGEMGDALLDAMLPGIVNGLSLFDDQVIGKAVQSVSGYDVAALAQDITQKADDAIWAAIGAQEAEIRANPQATHDPLLISVFGFGNGGQ